MYLVSLYFDEKTEERLSFLIRKMCEATGNSFMLDGKVPPHITVAAIRSKDQESVIEGFDRLTKNMKAGEVKLVSFGVLPGCLYILPVLNEYLQAISMECFSVYSEVEGILMEDKYKPFSWVPHITVGKTMDRQQVESGLKVLLNNFSAFSGKITSVGLSATNPYRDLVRVEL